jgi:peptidoglycan/LPS O-acetylase OafA/YrhL
MTEATGTLTEKPIRERGIGYVPELDTFRTIAILLVMCAHWLLPGAPINRVLQWGNFGVYLFFVLSGFLITRILVRCREDIEAARATIGFSIRQFYIRRFLRIFPLYYFVLFVAAALNAPGVRDALPWHVAYLSNAYFMKQGTFGGPASLFWSLSVEEQFYLLWPLAILILPLRAITPLVVGTFLLGTAIHAWTLLHDSWWKVMTPAVMNFLAAGALVAVCESKLPPLSSLFSRAMLLRIFLVLGCVLAVVFLLATQLPKFDNKVPWEKAILHTGASMLFAWMIARTADGVSGPIGAVLRFAPLVYLGKISYGLYVYHQFINVGLKWLDPHLSARIGDVPASWLTASFAARFFVTVAVASASWFLMEKPLNDLKRYFPYSRKPRSLALEERGVPIPSAATNGDSNASTVVPSGETI